MMEIRGKYNTAKIFTDVVDEMSIGQIQLLCDQEFAAGSKIRLMPDIHAGAGCTIGTTMTVTDKIVPNIVGVDIGCGMETVRIAERDIDLEKLDRLISSRIPSGFDIRETPHGYAGQAELEKLYCRGKIRAKRALLSVGTLGGGNHFIEADRDDDGNIYIVVHSGSRHLGVETAEYYQNEGYLSLNSASREDVRRLIERLKAEGRQKEIQQAIAELKKSRHCDVPKDLAYISGDTFRQYLHDMRIVQKFAVINRRAMMDEILGGLGLNAVERFTTIHNYIDTDAMILRKGAVSARAGEKLLIPMNMRDGSLICTGKGNDDWNCSAPHGAGRLMSRETARRKLNMGEFRKQMEGVYSTSVDESTIDESPMAYKPTRDILDNISDTVDVVKIIKPIYNFKAHLSQKAL